MRGMCFSVKEEGKLEKFIKLEPLGPNRKLETLIHPVPTTHDLCLQ